jgi:hypothetical protein
MKWKKIILISVLVVVLIGIIIGFFTGFDNLKKFLMYLFIALLVIGILFLLAYVFWLLFIKVEFKDIPAQWRKKLEMSAKLATNDMLGKLYVSGDEKHNRLCYGKYMYLRINMPKIMKEQIIEKGKPKLDDFGQPVFKDYTEEMPLDCFIVEQKGFFARLFGDPFFILVYPKDHDYSSVFNDVVLKGFNLVPLDNYFYTIDRHNLDIDLHKAIEMNYIKEAVVEQLRDLDKLVKGAINLDSKFFKDKERATEFELPALDKMRGNQQQ